MPRKVFTSFHYQNDNWRVQQVRNMGCIEGNSVATSNKWEEVVQTGDYAIQRWINENMAGKSCVIVLIGSQTATRKWVKYEIEKGWKDGKGVLGIHIHGLKDVFGNQATKGTNPFGQIRLNNIKLSSVVKSYDTPYSTSEFVYDYIKNNMEEWIDVAIAIRAQFPK